MNRSKIAKKAVKRGKAWEREVASDFEGLRKWWTGEDVETAEGLYIECKERQSISPWLEKALWEAEAYGMDAIEVIGFFVAMDYERAKPLIRGQDNKKVWRFMAVTKRGPKYIESFLNQAQRLAKSGDPGIVALKRIRRQGEYRAFRAILMRREDFDRFFIE